MKMVELYRKEGTNDGDLSTIYRENLKEIIEIILRT